MMAVITLSYFLNFRSWRGDFSIIVLSLRFNSDKFKLVFFSSNLKHVARHACRLHGVQEVQFQTLKAF